MVENPSYDGKARYCAKCNAWFGGWRIERDGKDGKLCPGCDSIMYDETQLVLNEETMEYEIIKMTKDDINQAKDKVFFYEHEFYVLSNFSSFRLFWKGIDFDTSEIAYHWEKFPDNPEIQKHLLLARSSHEAFKIAQSFKEKNRPDWKTVKVRIMLQILRAKANQHEYVRSKLLQTGNMELIEDSWRDNFWGWGENRDGQNMLGKLWMIIRDELRNKEIKNVYCYPQRDVC